MLCIIKGGLVLARNIKGRVDLAQKIKGDGLCNTGNYVF